jgi:hypothetical protein
MRWGSLLLSGIFTVGCASKQTQPLAVAPPPAAPIYDDAVAAALVYEPPMVANAPAIEITREGRAQAAYAGFDDVITTFYFLQVDDRQQSYNGYRRDRFERQAITTRVGVSYR